MLRLLITQPGKTSSRIIYFTLSLYHQHLHQVVSMSSLAYAVHLYDVQLGHMTVAV